MGVTATKAKELGTIVARARTKKGLSTRRLAARIGSSNAWVTKLEAGVFLDPSPTLLAKLVDELDIEPHRIDELMSGAVANSLPGMRAYFRTKFGMTPEEVERMAQYMNRYIDRDRRAA